MISKDVLECSGQIKSFSFSNMDEIMRERWGDQWDRYRENWRKVQLDFENVPQMPLYVLTELNSFCNLRCKMCKHAQDGAEIERKSMPVELFRRIVGELKEYEVPAINIGYGTECSLHPNFDAIISEVKESGCIDKFFLTNGTTLTEKVVNQIFDAGFERVEISVDAATNETYKKIRKNGDYEKLEKSIWNLINEKKRRNSKLPMVRLSFCVQDDNKDEIDLFYEKWKDFVDIIEYQKMETVIEKNPPKVSLRKCADPFNRVCIDYKGDIYPCCSILYQKEYCIGNLNEVSIFEAFNGERMKRLRESFKNGHLLPHCNRCLTSIYGE